jgi:hypothetical protein
VAMRICGPLPEIISTRSFLAKGGAYRVFDSGQSCSGRATWRGELGERGREIRGYETAYL